MNWYYYLVVAGFGLIFGSFFNVCIYRMPRDKQLGSRSACPSCGEMIHWYDNIPLASFAVLRGRCRGCSSAISWRYPMVELGTALLFALIYWWSVSVVPGELGISGGSAYQPEVLIGLVMVSVMIIAVGVDITHQIVPNKATVSGMILMLGVVVGVALYRGQPGRIWISLATGIGGGGFLLMAGTLYGMLFMKRAESQDIESNRDDDGPAVDSVDPEEADIEEEDEFRTGIGMGDVKLMVFMGMALGYFHWYLIVVEIIIGYLLGSIAAIVLMLLAGLGRKDRIPFVPFLAMGAVITLIWGQALVDVYLKLLW